MITIVFQNTFSSKIHLNNIFFIFLKYILDINISKQSKNIKNIFFKKTKNFKNVRPPAFPKIQNKLLILIFRISSIHVIKS